MKLTITIKNWKQFVIDMSSYLLLEPSHLHNHLQIDLQLDLQKIKHKSPLCFFAHAVYRSPDAWLCKWYLRPAASILFFFSFQYRICDISLIHFVNVKYRIWDTSSWTLALCLGLGYSERTINNAYAFDLHFESAFSIS